MPKNLQPLCLAKLRYASLLGALLPAAALAAVFQGNGIKIGEVTADSAIIWTRLTVAPEANWSGTPFVPPQLDLDRRPCPPQGF